MDMFEDPLDPNTPTLLRPLDIDINTPTQPDVHSRHQGRDEGVGTFQDPIPGGGSTLVNDPAGTSISLNLGIDPSSGTPILSGRAINSQGEVLDVHPCSCSDPVSPYHRLPLLGSLELTHGEAHARDNNHLHASPKSQSGVHRRPAPIFTQSWTPLIVVHTQLPQSPSGAEFYHIVETQGPETRDEPLLSPFTPTPGSVQYQSQGFSTSTFQTLATYPEGAPAPPTPLGPQTSLHRVLSLPSHHFWCQSTAPPPCGRALVQLSRFNQTGQLQGHL
ncbi:hypothetical protein BGW80DRAFT_1293331 [Lactifluus volemus]|nr:hypothetical protein BGW80DRAFT_1293331 [Lactifluus volemus]